MPGQKAAVGERRAQILAAAIQVAAAGGLDDLTIQRVAAVAGLSHGLVHFHFKTKQELLSALLDHVLHATAASEAVPPAARSDAPLDELLAVMRSEMARLTADAEITRLFFDFSVMGARSRPIRMRMSAELARYRRAFRPLVKRVLESEPGRFVCVTADGLWAVVVAFIKGSALQSVIDPRGFDASGFLAASSALLAQIESSASGSQSLSV